MGFKDFLNNPNLFSDNAPGAYSYADSSHGKIAFGQLTLASQRKRSGNAQRNAGGDDRRTSDNPYGVDDGGHLIGAIFGGSPWAENLTAQDRNLNRSAYRKLEKKWEHHLKNNDKVFVNIETYDYGNSGRPTNFMIYSIIEHTDENGKVTREIFFDSLNNESASEHQKWEEAEMEAMGSDPDASGGNSVMPYIWNDDLQDVEPNPNYHPGGGSVASGGEASAVASECSDGKGIPGKKDRDYDSILAGCHSFSEAVTGVRRTAMLLEKEISAAESVLTDSVSRKNMASLRGIADLIGKASAMAAARVQDLEKHVSQDKARFEELL
jgi:hypothetical protein